MRNMLKYTLARQEAMVYPISKTVTCLKAGIEDALPVKVLPEKYRCRIESTDIRVRFNP